MDKTEELVEMVLTAVETLLDVRLAPLKSSIAEIKRDIDSRGFITKETATATFASVQMIERQAEELRALGERVAADVAGRPTLDTVRAEQAVVASKTASELFATLRVPQDGKSVTVEDVRPLLEQMVAAIPRPKDGAPGRDGVDGKSVTPDEVRALVGEMGPELANLIPIPKDGAPGERGADGAAGRDGVDGKDGQPGRDGMDGKSVSVEEVQTMVDAAVTRAVAALPTPKDGRDGKDGAPGAPGRDGIDGKSIDPEEVRSVVDDLVREHVALIPKAKDGEPGPRGEPGRDGKDADIATVREIVSIAVKAAVADIPVPKDGAPGRDADPVDMRAIEAEIESRVRRAVDAMPRPKDGEDGLGFDDFALDLKDDGRTLVFRFTGGGREKTFEIVAPWQIYRGVWKAGDFTHGDVVTYGGSQWVAKRDTQQTPGTGDDWVLCVKRGKDGKDGSGA